MDFVCIGAGERLLADVGEPTLGEVTPVWEVGEVGGLDTDAAIRGDTADIDESCNVRSTISACLLVEEL